MGINIHKIEATTFITHSTNNNEHIGYKSLQLKNRLKMKDA